MRVLPITAIYGGNASGKTNLVMAFEFAKKLVVDGIPVGEPIPAEPFLLSKDHMRQPSRFFFELLIDEILYAFSFTVTREAILEEKLVKMTSTGEKTLYERHRQKITFPALAKKQKEKAFLRFVAQGTRANQLFLTNAVSQNEDTFRPIYDWFRDTLITIGPHSHFNLIGKFMNRSKEVSKLLRQLDTGIEKLGYETVPLDLAPTELRDQAERLREGESTRVHGFLGSQLYAGYVAEKRNNKLIVKKLITLHKGTDGEVPFDLHQESAGSRRLLDLLPVFMGLISQKSNQVFVIDEIGSSLHTLLIRDLIERYLFRCSAKTRSQLILTTHDVMLMDRELLRRDEMWVTERDFSGATQLIAFSEYEDIRYKKEDVRKSYLQGRMGGIPRILRANIPDTTGKEHMEGD